MLGTFGRIAMAGCGLLGVATVMPTDASARAPVIDHRGTPPIVGTAQPTENFAIQSGWRVKCVLPFCGHDFNPSRERSRDHRGPPNRPPRR